jgi:hypothetical protein
MTVFYSVLFTGYILAQENEESTVNRINRVDHERYQLIVNDKIYIMPITLEVYTFNLKTRKRTKVNRYALKKEQVIALEKTIRNRKAYIDKITIYK